MSAAPQAARPVASGETGRLVWVAFQCVAFAEMSDNMKEQERLFALGYENGKRFLDAVRSNKITQEDIKKTVPVAVLDSIGGPTHEFILGRIFQNAVRDAYDQVVKQRDSGIELPLADWRTDPAVQKSRAADKYRGGNCGLVK